MKKFKNKKGTRIYMESVNSGIMIYITSKKKLEDKILYLDDNCILESMYDFKDCIDFLQYDKIARKWLRRFVLSYCINGKLVQDYIMNNGNLNWSKIKEDDNIIKSKEV